MKISVFVHDLASNPIGRLHPILQALRELGYEIEVFGLLISGSEIYLPYRDKYEYSTLSSNGTVGDVLKKADILAQRASGDIIYAGKPLLTSFYPALRASGFGRKKPLLLDIEDDDVWAPDGGDTFRGKIQFYVRGFKRATSCKYGVLLHPFTACAVHKTVSSRKLRQRYGGTILLHGPNERQFDPSLSELTPSLARKRFGVPPDVPVIGFAGTPHRHKGFDLLLEGTLKSELPFHLLLCGETSHPLFLKAAELFGDRCHFTGMLPNEAMPEFLAATDITPILQRRTRYAEAQMPAKILEAMAMGKLIVGARVGDIPLLLGEDSSEKRGWLVDPESSDSFTAALIELHNTPREQCLEVSKAVRNFYLENASVLANANKLKQILALLKYC